MNFSVDVGLREVAPQDGFRCYEPDGKFYCKDENGVVSVLTQSEAAEFVSARA